ILAEIETDKADVEMEAFGAGVLRKIPVGPGDRAPVGSLIAVIAEPNDDIASVIAGAASPAPAAGKPAAPASVPGATSDRSAAVPPQPRSEDPAARQPAPAKSPAGPGAGSGPQEIRREPAARPAAPVMAPVASVSHADGRIKASPLAKKVAAQRGVDLKVVQGSGPGGRIIRRDVEAATSALALLQHPEVNASFQGDSVRVWHRAHIGIAVALEDGLITPVLRDCQAKSLSQIAVESRDLAERTRARKLKAHELSGATFSISNLGMFDVAEFSAIINPPEGAILAVGSVRRVPVADGDEVTVGRRMMLTISCDHRVMDGAMGARFLQTVKRYLEEPLRLLV